MNKDKFQTIFINFINEKKSIALFCKKFSNNFFDCFTPIHFQTKINKSEIENNFEDIKFQLKKRGCIFLYIQTKNDDLKIEDINSNTTNFRSNYYLDLEQSKISILQNQKKDAHYRLNKIIKKKYKLNKYSKDIRNFFIHYKKNQNNKNFSSKYCYNESDFLKIVNIKNIDYLEILNEKNEFLSGGIFAKSFEEVDYLYGVDSGIEQDATRLLIYEAAMHFKNNFFKKLYLGGGTTENDSLSIFKERLGGKPLRCCRIQSVINLEEAEKRLKKKFDIDWFNGYFPPSER